VIDGFIINDELDLLELRLEVLWDSVDRFVAVEQRYTFMQQPKPLHLTDNIERFEKYREKLRVISADCFSGKPATPSATAWMTPRKVTTC
jgi:beta-1,4-mannosyl-glycoprotein beta-1,4-N-acetylglucosaminyltransferase